MKVTDIDRNSNLLDATWAIYRSVFPEYERVPEDAVLDLVDASPAITLSAYQENGVVSAMTFLLDFPDLPFAYLLFLGVSEESQGSGLGTRVLSYIKQRCRRPVLLDMEIVNDPQADNPEQRQRRLRFYRKNGFTQTGLLLPYDGVPFEVMIHGMDITQQDVDTLQDKMEDLYARYC